MALEEDKVTRGSYLMKPVGFPPTGKPTGELLFSAAASLVTLKPAIPDQLNYARACGTASFHRPCAFKISSMTSRAAPWPASSRVT
jgi:hypothetical protein